MTQPQPAAWQATLDKHAPELLKDVLSVRQSVLTDGALSLKVKTLMTMLCDALLAHPEGVANIANRARALGASEEEIGETVAVAFLMGGMPALVTGANAFRDRD
jgi:alkylhydroperoxidase/carboxymuconolactone decarboxylase family protein YurZ